MSHYYRKTFIYVSFQVLPSHKIRHRQCRRGLSLEQTSKGTTWAIGQIGRRPTNKLKHGIFLFLKFSLFVNIINANKFWYDGLRSKFSWEEGKEGGGGGRVVDGVRG